MIPDKLFKDTAITLKDVEDLTDILNDDINKACAYFYYVHGMTEITRTMIHAFYKLRIKILEMAVRQHEELKASHEFTISDPDCIANLAKHQAELEEANESYLYFKINDKIREE